MSGQLHQDGDEEFPSVVHAECLGQEQLEHETCEYSEGKVVATEMSEVLKVDKARNWEGTPEKSNLHQSTSGYISLHQSTSVCIY